MKILAIRGCNLASLAGEFEIDLAHGPLGAAGVFAIVGNTGAGKSTLLDALCVALFDRTPRLTNHSRVVVGRGDDDPSALGAQDVRTLLRRGAASGWAEVDFESGDAQRYRARWSVRRARGHSDGTIQAQQVTLTTLDGGERLGGTKTETLEAIHARLGLTFDQFRRSALLAQGEFAAFLRADGKDRSELLERMTGTEIYTRLSVRAHLKAALVDQRLRDSRAAALAIGVLDDDARNAAEADLALAEEAKAAARGKLAAAELAARWSVEAAQRAEMLAAARAGESAAVTAVAQAEVERAELGLRRRAEALRGPWEQAMRVDRQHAIVRTEVAAVSEAARRAAAAHAAIGTRRAELVALHEPIRAARIAAGIVESAPRVEPKVGARAEPRAEASAEPRAEPSAEPSAKVSDGEARAGASDGDARAAIGDAHWVMERRMLAREIGGWAELETKFAQHAALGDAIGVLDRSLVAQAESHAKLIAGRAGLVAEQQALVAKLTEAQRKAEAFHKKRTLPLEAARKQEDEARLRLTEVERLVSIAAGARESVKAQTELDRQLAELTELGELEAAQHREVVAARATGTVLKLERARVVAELRRAAGYDHARTELRAGEECPLCGAVDHPWADRGTFDDVIAAAEARLVETTAELEHGTATLATLAARAHHRDRERTRLEGLRAKVLVTASGAFGIWREHLTALGELLLIDDPASPAAAELAKEREIAAKKRLEEARDVRRQTEAAVKAVAEAQAAVQGCQADVDQLTARLTEVARRIAELETVIERQKGERAGRAERHAELAAELDAAIARWTAAVPAADAAAARGPVVRGGRGRDASHDRPRSWIAELAAIWRSRAERVASADAALTASLVAVDRDARDTERAVAEHATRLVDAEGRRDGLIAELAEAVAVLDAARTGSGFEVEELHRLMAADPSRLDALAEALAVLDREVERARTLVTERRRLVDDHAGARPDSIDDADHVPALAAALVGTEQHAARLAAGLAADGDARERRTRALALLAVAEDGAHVDRILGEVIGSHDGKLFRSFAQSLTLDGLLAVANAHLEELAPRYQLERVPRHDLELQVIDRDLGHDVRSVQSLSGGETFLVSLALALGLSSMSAHDVRVRTLLIDEGFGTLDATTLEMALSVLEALRQAGRQVGVISHVPQLVDRVGAHVRVVQLGGGRSEVIVA